MKKILIPLVLIIFLSIKASISYSATCGDTITQDTTLESDLKDCSGDGLIVGTDNITLRLNGHTISGTFATGSNCNGTPTAGIKIDGRKDIEIIGPGKVEGFGDGLFINLGSDIRVEGITTAGNCRNGIALINVSDSYIERSTVSENKSHGIFLDTTTNTSILGNTVSSNGTGGSCEGGGIRLISFSPLNNIEGNSVSKNGGDGIRLEKSTYNNILATNTVSESASSCDDIHDLGTNSVVGDNVCKRGSCP